MKRGVLFILVAMLAGVTAFFVMKRQQEPEADHLASGHGIPGLLWLRSELKLSEDQFTKVRALHDAYQPKCEQMCERIAASHQRVEGLSAKVKELTPELSAALKEHADVHLDCQRAMLGHLFETAAAMEPVQARRYLDLVLPYAADFAYSEGGCPLCGANANPTSNGSK
ncbi:MAG: hypothetical protein RLZZ179_2309 [Verrucomicrobiota bacterium]|jgi:hypothetical protein